MIKDLTGTTGRLDIIFRCILAAFSFGKHDIIFQTVLNGPPDPPKSIEFNGNRLNELPTDEIQMARLFQTILDPKNQKQIEGITLRPKSFLQSASELARKGPIFLLQEDGLHFLDYSDELINKKAGVNSLIFILSDHIDLKPQEKEYLIERLGATQISLGSQSYLASHCIIFLLMKLKEWNFVTDIKR